MLLDCSGPHALSLAGGIYCMSTSEMVEFSVSALHAAVGFSVPLKEGMRPAPIVVEEIQVVETSKDEKHEEKAEETAAAAAGDITAEQPAYVLLP